MNYDEQRLGVYIDKSEFTYLMGHVNNTVNSYWPCATSIWMGYILAPYTLGLSFLVPNVCMKDAREALI